MAARRSLGGGRVLSSGKGLAPPPPEPFHPPVTGLLSPSESSVSLNSQASSTPASTDHEDLASRVALGGHGTTVAAATSRMVCPICNEEMMTLLQLNRHIDDNHANLEEEEQDEVKTWFKSQMTKAKKFQPLAVLNQKLRGLEVFESNDEQGLVSHVVTRSHSSGTTSPIPAAPGAMSAAITETPHNAEELVTRKHWQKASGFDACADPMCVGLDVNTTDASSEKPGVKTAVDIRMCKDCQHTVFGKADFMREATTSPPDQRAYQNLLQFEHGIRLLLPRFQRLLLTLQDPEKPPSTATLADAAKVRKRLTDAFTQYDFAARRVRDLPTESPTQKRLQKAVHQQAAVFLHIHMLPLKSLPKVLRHISSSTKPTNGHPQSALSQVKFNDTLHRPGSSRGSSTSSLAVTALEAQEKELRERMIVLEEQKFMVETMIADANKRRQFDELSALAGNVEDLSREIDQVQGELAQMDFAGLYAAGDGVVK
ncbi:hypothetical protein B0A48_11748 [Cryoendolithus antarcticus]|uniref:C2H2-type domain-containing protein n=1 Tax=Cryoendolithus antarcticus TaxID=1507870 RepID=A0A1V8SSM8_9PEZI|nr:hypothetical protein B0A48_11748 [Cryoendolithus antarcticus]